MFQLMNKTSQSEKNYESKIIFFLLKNDTNIYSFKVFYQLVVSFFGLTSLFLPLTIGKLISLKETEFTNSMGVN